MQLQLAQLAVPEWRLEEIKRWKLVNTEGQKYQAKSVDSAPEISGMLLENWRKTWCSFGILIECKYGFDVLHPTF